MGELVMGWGLGVDWSGASGPWLANQVVVRGTLILLVTLVATALLRRSSAAVRHGVWLLAVGALVFGPLVATSRTPLGGREVAVAGVAPASDRPGEAVHARRAKRSGRALTDASPTPPRLPRLPVPEEWIWIWATGAILLLLRLLRHTRRAERLRAEALPLGSRLEAVFGDACNQVCPNMKVSAGFHPGVTTPAVIGTSRPVVLLPPTAGAWPEERLRSALWHELAHVLRRDYPLHLLSSVVLALYWATPLAWVARHLLFRERERACDERVVAWGTRPTDYARHLVEVARDARVPPGIVATALVGGGDLGRRVRQVLSANAPASWPLRRWVLGGAVAVSVAGFLSGLAPFQTPRETRRTEALARLASADPEERRHGAWMLGELESAGDVATLESALEDDVPAVRTAAAWALGEIKDPLSGPALARLLSDPDSRAREMAALSIGEIGDPASVATLRAALADHPDLAGPVRWALSEIGGIHLLEEIGLLGADEPLPDPAVWAGHLEHATSPETVPIAELMQELAAGEAEGRRASALALGRLGSEDAVDLLLEALEDEAPEVRAAAVWALDEINPSR